MTDINFTDFIFTDIIIHSKASSVQIMSVIIMSDNVISRLQLLSVCCFECDFELEGLPIRLFTFAAVSVFELIYFLGLFDCQDFY